MIKVLVKVLRGIVIVMGVLIVAVCGAVGYQAAQDPITGIGFGAIMGTALGVAAGVLIAVLFLGVLALFLEMRDFLEELCELTRKQVATRPGTGPSIGTGLKSAGPIAR